MLGCKLKKEKNPCSILVQLSDWPSSAGDALAPRGRAVHTKDVRGGASRRSKWKKAESDDRLIQEKNPCSILVQLSDWPSSSGDELASWSRAPTSTALPLQQSYAEYFMLTMTMMMSWCLMSSDVIWHIRDKLWPMPKHGSIKSTYVRCMCV